jgi:hypothetical protein
MTRRNQQVQGGVGIRPWPPEPQEQERCLVPYSAMIDPGRHTRFCGNPHEQEISVDETK